ncbi:hypothetical protein GW17_00033325 [Ensete ventricosum]|nr:hypothetical protein GW17_00033325 [Ensete ventricosum]RZS13030.1 hypothetical protein BHM03_00044550 [Ensete ventricosum]
MGAAPAGVTASDCPFRRQLLPVGGLPTGVVQEGIAPVGGYLYSLAAATSSPFAGDLGHGRPPLQGALAVAGRTCKGPDRRSYIPVLQIWIEKMKEVKRPSL